MASMKSIFDVESSSLSAGDQWGRGNGSGLDNLFRGKYCPNDNGFGSGGRFCIGDGAGHASGADGFGGGSCVGRGCPHGKGAWYTHDNLGCDCEEMAIYAEEKAERENAKVQVVS